MGKAVDSWGGGLICEQKRWRGDVLLGGGSRGAHRPPLSTPPSMLPTSLKTLLKTTLSDEERREGRWQEECWVNVTARGMFQVKVLRLPSATATAGRTFII